MTTRMQAALIGIAVYLLFLPCAFGAQFDLPETLPPEEFGNILINRTSVLSGVKPAAFSHWSHRQKFTCRVCHFELEFDMLTNATKITEAGNREGKHCGAAACHDGKAAFGHREPHCSKCHNGNLRYGVESFDKLKKFPKTAYGNEIDWVKALVRGMITPANYLTIKPPADIAVIKPLVLEAEWAMIPPAIFSHKKHVAWLDCNNCHPDVFNIKKKTTKHFAMARILQREFCGICHLTVAFPMNDCKRCHPGRSKHQE